ncbi:hypothetical protein FACS189447_09820 [Spirochaetia bacterium]|nr:hypothetical protein FACS189447_09820 [Spirochaetia bacterium]
MTYVLDACALIALLDDEEGKDKVDELFTRAKTGEIVLCISIINMLEVYYGFIRDDGLECADKIPATAINLNGVFVTSDGEFEEPEAKEHAPVFWFRPPKEKK